MTKKDRRRITYEVGAFIALVIILVFYAYSDYLTINENILETEKLDGEYIDLLEEEVTLNSEVTKLQDEDYLARYAREKFFFSKEGELIIRIID